MLFCRLPMLSPLAFRGKIDTALLAIRIFVLSGPEVVHESPR